MKHETHGAHGHDEFLNIAEEIAYFDARAASWDSEHPAEPEKMRALLACAELRPGAKVLDVGSGTGVTVPYLLELVGGGGEIRCADASRAMLDVSRAKHGDAVTYICADVMDDAFVQHELDAVICYNVFPHIRRQPDAVRRMAQWLRAGGTLLIAHGQGRDFINRMHGGMEPVVREDRLPPMGELRELMRAAGLSVIHELDEPDRFAISGKRV